jgi:hypothetical protein
MLVCQHSTSRNALMQVAVLKHPLQHGAPLWSAARLAYVVLLAAYWGWNLVHLIADLKSLAEVCCCARAWAGPPLPSSARYACGLEGWWSLASCRGLAELLDSGLHRFVTSSMPGWA